MPQEKSEALVLRGVDFSETSRVVTFLTPGRGQLACMARGARRTKNGMAGLLDRFNQVEIVYLWKEGRSVQQLTDATLLDRFAGVRSDLAKAAFAAFPLEIAYKVSHENEPSHELYRELVRGIRSLADWRGDARRHACWQALRVLSAAGFAPAVEDCAVCGRPAENARGFAWAGGVTCAGCPADRPLTAGEAWVLRELVLRADACAAAPPGPDLFPLVWRYASEQLETGFRSVRVIMDMFG